MPTRHPSWRDLILLAGAAGSSACASAPKPRYGEVRWADLGRACAADAPRWGPPASWRDSLAISLRRSRSGPDPDQQAAALATRIPGGFAGLHFPEGHAVIFLVDTSQRAEALAVLDSLAHPRAPGNRPLDLTTVQARPVRWDYATLYAWYTYLLQHGAWVPGTVMTDVQEDRNRILLGVQDERARARLERALRALKLPCHLVAVELMRPIRLLQRAAPKWDA